MRLSEDFIENFKTIVEAYVCDALKKDELTTEDLSFGYKYDSSLEDSKLIIRNWNSEGVHEPSIEDLIDFYERKSRQIGEKVQSKRDEINDTMEREKNVVVKFYNSERIERLSRRAKKGMLVFDEDLGKLRIFDGETFREF